MAAAPPASQPVPPRETVAGEVAPAPSGFLGSERPEYADYSRCIHCGLCLNQCPTYRLWHLEADSPRGRIRQMMLVDQGRLKLSDSFVTHIDRCLDCRACETACPSGVEYGKLVELARTQIEKNYRRPLVSRVLRDFVYRGLLPYPRLIVAAARLLRFYQRSGCVSISVRDSRRSLAEPGFCACSGCAIASGCCPRSTRRSSSASLARRFQRRDRDAHALPFSRAASRK